MKPILTLLLILSYLSLPAATQTFSRPLAFPSSSDGANLTANLIAYWNLDEASGNRSDSWTNSLTMVDNNTVTQATGPGGAGNAAQFTAASSEYLSVSVQAAAGQVLRSQVSDGDGIQTKFTLTCWLYVDSTGSNRALFDMFSDAVTRNYRIDYTGSKPRFTVSTNGTIATGELAHTGTLTVSTWYFIACGYDNDTAVVWISVNNGTVETLSYSLGIASKASISTCYIGRSHSTGDFYMNGRIARMGVWKRHLTAAEITYLYNSGIGRTYPFP